MLDVNEMKKVKQQIEENGLVLIGNYEIQKICHLNMYRLSKRGSVNTIAYGEGEKDLNDMLEWVEEMEHYRNGNK